MAIRDIRELCNVHGDRVFPNLRLTELPSEQCVSSLFASIGHFHIQSLELNEVAMALDGAANIASIMENTKLLHLVLIQSDVTDDIPVIILNALSNSILTLLNLQRDMIGANGAKLIAGFLTESKLTSLSLRHNLIGDAGVREIAAALPESKLSSLDLKSNRPNWDRVKAIGSVLHRSGLASLDLGYNEIGDEGARQSAA